MKELIHGDCLEIMPNILDKSVDCIICDLPYGTTACKWDIILPFDKLWEQYNRIIKDFGTIVLFGSEPFSSLLRTSNLECYKYDIIWQKNNAGNFQLVNHQPLKIHENISIFIKETHITVFSEIVKNKMVENNINYETLSSLFLSKNGNKTGWLFNKLYGNQLFTKKQWQEVSNLLDIKESYEDLLSKVPNKTYNVDVTNTNKKLYNKNKGGNLGHLNCKSEIYIQTRTGYPKSIIEFDRENKFHPTQKPLALLEFLVKTYSNEGDLVGDFYLGSGTTVVACRNLNRKFIGCDINQKAVDLTLQRLEYIV